MWPGSSPRELRIGLREGHLEAGIAKAFERDQAAVQWAGMLTGDIGATAVLAARRQLDRAELALFHPLKCMLASPVADEAAALARMPPPVWVEDKYDGIRAQLHKLGSARCASTAATCTTSAASSPRSSRPAATSPWTASSTARCWLARRHGAAVPDAPGAARPEGPVGRDPGGGADDLRRVRPAGASAGGGRSRRSSHCCASRCASDGRGSSRSGLPITPGFGIANLVTAADEAELATIFSAAQQRGNEGLMVKDPDSIYTPGRRGYGWIKLKRPLTTLDCVVVGVEVGHGKRHGVLSDYTFAVLDDRPEADDGALVTIGKAYSGLTDAEIAEMTRWFEEHTLRQLGRYRRRRADRRGRDRLRRDPPLEPARVRVRAALSAHRAHPRRQAAAEIDRLRPWRSLHDQLQAGGRYSVSTAAR